MVKRRKEFGKLNGVVVRSKTVADALTEARGAVESMEARLWHERSELERARKAVDDERAKLNAYRQAGFWRLLGYALGVVDMP